MNDTGTGTGTARHPVNVGHLVMGLAFLFITAGWALVQTDAVTGADIRWLLPVPWLVAGAVGVAVTAWTGLRRRTPDTTPTTDTTDTTDTTNEENR